MATGSNDWRAEHEAAFGDEHDEGCPLCGVDAQTDELRESEVTLVIRVQHHGSMVPALMLAAMAAQGVANGTGERGRVTARVQSACIVDQRPLTHGEGFGLRTGRDDREVVA